MKKIDTFRNGPCYYALNIGKRIIINSRAIELVGISFTGLEGQREKASDGMIVLRIDEAQESGVLGTHLSDTNLGIGAEIIRNFNTEPYRLSRQNECWKLSHDARIFVSSP